MKQRGQVTLIIILGILALFVVLFLFYARDQIIEKVTKTTNVQQQLKLELTQIEKDISVCINKETTGILKTLAQNGGTLPYKGNKITILCQNIPETNNCLATPLLAPSIEKEVQPILQEKVRQCIDLSPFQGKNYEISSGDLTLTFIIHPRNVLVSADYPLTLKQGEYTVQTKTITKEIDVPFGRLLTATNEILSQRSTTGNFDPLPFVLIHLNEFNLEEKKPYPNEIYSLSLRTQEDYTFWFAVTAQGRFNS